MFLARLAGNAHRARQGFAGLILYMHIQPNANYYRENVLFADTGCSAGGQRSCFGKFERSGQC